MPETISEEKLAALGAPCVACGGDGRMEVSGPTYDYQTNCDRCHGRGIAAIPTAEQQRALIAAYREREKLRQALERVIFMLPRIYALASSAVEPPIPMPLFMTPKAGEVVNDAERD